MARSWAQLLGEENAQPEPEEDRAGLFSRLRDSLSKSRRALTAELASAAFDPGDEAAWERLEEALIRADVGVRATASSRSMRRSSRCPRKANCWGQTPRGLTPAFRFRCA